MSGPGCNLVGEGTTSAETGSAAAAGKCVCGPSVPWCPGEPRPYMYATRHECKLNLEAKIAYGRTHSFHMRDVCPVICMAMLLVHARFAARFAKGAGTAAAAR